MSRRRRTCIVGHSDDLALGIEKGISMRFGAGIIIGTIIGVIIVIWLLVQLFQAVF